jgi:hypothetical protein
MLGIEFTLSGLVLAPVVNWPRTLMKRRRRVLSRSQRWQEWQPRNQHARENNFACHGSFSTVISHPTACRARDIGGRRPIPANETSDRWASCAARLRQVGLYLAHCCHLIFASNPPADSRQENRGKTLFSIIEVVVQNILTSDPERVKMIGLGARRSITTITWSAQFLFQACGAAFQAGSHRCCATILPNRPFVR